MGLWRRFKDWFKAKFFSREMSLTFTGLQNAGKTTLVNVLASGEFDEDTIPTIGLNMRQVKKGKVKMKMWDIGGQPRFRSMWERYARNCSIIIYVVDSANPDTIPDAKVELHTLLANETLAKVPLLVLANKNDVEGHLSAEQVSEQLDLKSLGDREIGLYSISAKNNVNIEVTMQWIMDHSKTKPKKEKHKK